MSIEIKNWTARQIMHVGHKYERSPSDKVLSNMDIPGIGSLRNTKYFTTEYLSKTIYNYVH